jgi:arylsulfatase A-like enzyme
LKTQSDTNGKIGGSKVRSIRVLIAAIIAIASLYPAGAAAQPNVLLIVTDDQRWDDLDEIMPLTKSRIFDQGRRFMKGYITTPACCPSRACILTGMHASVNKVLANRYQLNKKTIFEYLKEKYYQGLIGKYLNTWDGSPRPELDYWVSFQGGSSRYFNPILFVNSPRPRKVKGYITEIFQEHAIKFINNAVTKDKPFFLAVTFNAPHTPAIPMPGDVGRYDNIPLGATNFPNYLLSVSNKIENNRPYWLRERNLSPRRVRRLINQSMRERECLASVDRAVDAILTKLEDIGELDNTIVFFLSDNGVMRGEHNLQSKDTVYESAIKVPFAVRYPPLISPAVDNDNLVAGIDIVPTVYHLTGIPKHKGMTGKSMLPIFNNSSNVFRDYLFVEGFRSLGTWVRIPFAAVHTGQYVFVKNQRRRNEPRSQRFELYDLVADPYQMVNQFSQDDYSSIQEDLARKLRTALRRYRGTTGFTVPGAVVAPPKKKKRPTKEVLPLGEDEDQAAEEVLEQRY